MNEDSFPIISEAKTTHPHLLLSNYSGQLVVKKHRGKLRRVSLQVRTDLSFVTYATKIKWVERMKQVAKAARKDGHKLDGWAARHKYLNFRNKPQFFVAVCKRCRGVFFAESNNKETYWRFPYGKCRAMPRRVVRIGNAVVVSGEPTHKAGFKRKFV